MKKVLFTTLAVVLFSVVSMANTKEIKIEKKQVKTEVSTKEVKTKISNLEVVVETCKELAIRTYDGVRALGGTHQEATTIGLRAYDKCISAKSVSAE